MTGRERAYLTKHADAPLAWGHGRLWTLDWDGTSGHRAPAGAVLTEDEDGDLPAVRVLALRPLRRRSRRFAGNSLRGWGIFWTVVAVPIGLTAPSDKVTWLTLALGALLATMLLPGILLRATSGLDRRQVLPLEVLRERSVDDGLHEVQLRDVDGSQVTLIATATLATTLLLSSDFDASPVMVPLTPGDYAALDLTTRSSADVKRRRDTSEVMGAAAFVNPAFPAAHYPPERLEAHLDQVARVAGISRAQLAQRIEPLATKAKADDEDGDVDGFVGIHVTRAANAALGWAIVGGPIIAVVVTQLAHEVTFTWPW